MSRQYAQRQNLSSENQLSSLNSSTIKLGQQSPQSTIAQIPSLKVQIQSSPIKYINIEQQNTYGRFIPYFLLKDQLPCQPDNTGHTILHHLCSHNSQYLPLYLENIDIDNQVLNRPSRVGHKPLDVAGTYCRKRYIDLLKQKGAIDRGNVDQWAIQSANIYNWSGYVDPNKKYLIHWAAYNDMPQVLLEFHKQGLNIHQKDGNDFTPVDLAVINKSYKSVKLLASLNFRPKEQILKNCDSRSIVKIFADKSKSSKQKRKQKLLKLSFVPIFCLINLFLLSYSLDFSIRLHYALPILTLSFWLALIFLIRVTPEDVYPNHRQSHFHSSLLNEEINPKSNLKTYIFELILINLTGFQTILTCSTDTYYIAFLYLVLLFTTLVHFVHLLTVVYGIANNLTHHEMFHSHQCKYLWNTVYYIQEKKILARKFHNPIDRGVKENFKIFFNRT